MPHISKQKLKKETLRQLDKKLVSTFENAYESRAFAKVFRELFTRTEKIMFAKRLAIVFLLSKEIPQHRIVDMLKVSPSTVAKMSLKLENGKFETIIKTTKKKNELVNFIEFLLTAGGTMPPIAGRGRWQKIFKEF